MKATNIKWMVLSTVAVLATSLAQANDKPGDQTQSQSDSTSQPQAIRLSKLMEAKAMAQGGEDLGKIEDLLINPTNGKIDFVVLGRGGFLGIGEKKVPVPWKAVNLQSEKQFTLNVDKKKLQSAPTLSRDYSDLSNPDYAVTVYRFYEIPIGAGESPGGSLQGHDTGTKDSKDSQQSGDHQNQP